MEMEPDVISQTALDQLVCSEQSQMLKALIPYTSSGNQQFLALYAKLMEFQNTVALFRGGADLQSERRNGSPGDAGRYSEIQLWKKPSSA